MANPIITSDKVEGTAVYNGAGDKLGSIDHLVIDKLSGNVRYAALEFGGFMGIGSDRYPVPWGMLKYDTTKDGYVVPLTKEQLEGAPSHRRGEQPAYSDDYGRSISDFYGVPYL